MPRLPAVYADFQNADAQGRLRLNCVGTVSDLSRQQVQLADGVRLLLYADDLSEEGREDRLMAEGVVIYSSEEQCWVAAIDWDQVRHESQLAAGQDANFAQYASMIKRF